MRKTITTKISTWGNGYGIRLPKSFVNEIVSFSKNSLEVSMNDEFSMLIKPKIEKKVLSKDYFRDALKKMKRIKKEDGGELDWGRSVGKEIW